MTNPTRPFAVLALSAATLLAQGDPVSPPHFTAVESGTSNPNPLGVTDQLARYLQIHEDLPATPLLVRGIAFRRNADASSHAPFDLELEMRMSVPLTTAAAPSATFADNHNLRSSAVVVRRRVVNFPAGDRTSILPRPFDYAFPFDVPFTVQGRAVWEMSIHSRTNPALILFDSIRPGSGEGNPLPSVLVYGQGCVATGRTGPLSVNGGAIFDWPNGGGRMAFGASNGPSNAIAVAAIGFDNQSWAGIPLPFEIPNSSLGASDSCWVWNDLFTTFAGSTNATGVYSSPLVALPLDPAHHGVTLHHHVLCFDAAANPFGLVSSNAMARQIVAPYPTSAVSLVGVRGSLGAVGIVNTGGGLVTQFRL